MKTRTVKALAVTMMTAMLLPAKKNGQVLNLDLDLVLVQSLDLGLDPSHLMHFSGVV